MKEFMLVFRNAGVNGGVKTPQPSQAEIQANEKQWADWMGSIAASWRRVISFHRLTIIQVNDSESRAKR